MAVERTLGKAFKDAGTILNSNKAINSINDFFLGGFKDIHSNMKLNNDTLVDAVKKVYSKNADGTGGLAYGKIAGSYLTAAAGYRVATGGGVYKDGNGNTNLIGVPFV